MEKAGMIRGLKVTWQPELLRHFLAELEWVSEIIG
jgi:tryptophanase